MAIKADLDALLKNPEDPILYHKIGAALLDVGDLENAQKYLDRALELAPDSREILLGCAALAKKRYAWRRAAALYRRCLALCPGDGEALSGLADCCYGSGDYAAAAENLEQYKRLQGGCDGT